MHRVLLIGQGRFAGTALESLLEHVQVVGLIRRPTTLDDAALRLARVRKVPVYCDEAQDSVERAICETKPEGVVLSMYDQLIPAQILNSVPILAVKFAPLPRLRGCDDVSWSILLGDRSTALTIFRATESVDAGPIIFQQSIDIGVDDTATTVTDRLNALQREHLGAAVQRHLAGGPTHAQDESRATYCCKRRPRDGYIDWSMPATKIYAAIRAGIGSDVAAYTYVGLIKVEIAEATIHRDGPLYEGANAGRVVSIHLKDESVDVLTGEGIVRILRLRGPDGSIRAATALVQDIQSTLGLQTEVLLRRVHELDREVATLRYDAGLGAATAADRATHPRPCGARAPDPALHAGGLPSAAMPLGMMMST